LFLPRWKANAKPYNHIHYIHEKGGVGKKATLEAQILKENMGLSFKIPFRKLNLFM